MTAVATPYDELLVHQPLTEATVDRLGEDALASLLRRRFRCFLACGWSASEALLLAVGYSEADAALIAHEPAVLHRPPGSAGSGSTAAPSTRTSKWRCGPVASPVAPTRPRTEPVSTRSPRRTAASERCA